MDTAADQGGAAAVMPYQSFEDRVKQIPQVVHRQVLLFKAVGGYAWMRFFKATRAEVQEAAEKAEARMCALELRLAVAEDVLRNTSIINRCIETYEERVAEMLERLAGPRPVEPAKEPAAEGPAAEAGEKTDA